jgi:hypothetical protein
MGVTSLSRSRTISAAFGTIPVLPFLLSALVGTGVLVEVAQVRAFELHVIIVRPSSEARVGSAFAVGNAREKPDLQGEGSIRFLGRRGLGGIA